MTQELSDFMRIDWDELQIVADEALEKAEELAERIRPLLAELETLVEKTKDLIEDADNADVCNSDESYPCVEVAEKLQALVEEFVY